MEEDKQIDVTAGSDSTEKHQNGSSPMKRENKSNDEGPFEVSSIQLSDNQDEPPLQDLEEAPKSPIAPYRNRWVRGMENPNKPDGSPDVKSPVTKFTPASMEHTPSELSKDFNASDLAKELLSVDESALDGSAVTDSLLESSFTGPGSTNYRLEAAYMWTKTENNTLLQKIKDLEEAAAAREKAKLEKMPGVRPNSPLKWAQEMIGLTRDTGYSSEESNADEAGTPPMLDRKTKLPTQLYPTELNGLALPTLSPSTINSGLGMSGQSDLEETADLTADLTADTTADTTSIEKQTRSSSSSFRRMMLLFLLALICTILLVHRARVAIVLKDAKEKAADKLGMKLDWDSEILPMAKRYSGKQSNTPLEGMNVVVVRASTEVGKELIDVFSKLGAQVIGVDGSAKSLASIKASKPAVETINVDFADLNSAAKGAADIASSVGHIDFLINCDNSYSRDSGGETKQGYDKHFEENYLSEFLLTNELLEPLTNSSRGTLVHVQSMAHILADGSDLQVEEATNQPLASVPGNVNDRRAYSSSLLASNLHYQHLSQTQKQVTIKSVTSTPFVPAMSVRGVLANVFGETDSSVTDSVHSSLKSAKHKLGVLKNKVFGTGEFANAFEDEELVEGLMEWSEEAASPYLWKKLEPETVDIVKETASLKENGSCVYEASPENETPDVRSSEINAFYASSVATLLSVGSVTLLRQMMPSVYGDV